MFTYFVASPTEWSRGLIRRRGDLFAPVLPRLVRSQDILLRPRVVGLGRPKNSVGVLPSDHSRSDNWKSQSEETTLLLQDDETRTQRRLENIYIFVS